MHAAKLLLPLALLASATAASAAPPPRLSLPLACTIGRDCWVQNLVDTDDGPGARDFACGSRTYNGHDGTDIRINSIERQRNGVAVLAAAPGQVLRTRDGEPDHLLDSDAAAALSARECGNGVVIAHGDGWETQYCHMKKGSIAVRPGQQVARGATLGAVGLSGATSFPHLHIGVRHQGRPIDPFAAGAPAGACNGGSALWATGSGVAAPKGAVIASGFAPGPVSLAAVVDRGSNQPQPGRESDAIVAYTLAIGLEQGDALSLVLLGPDGREWARNAPPPLAKAKAQMLLFAGRRRPEQGWPARLSARYTVIRSGKTALIHEFKMNF